ncbi:hypothetical protein, partial [Sunxiuqinia sp. sy24]|uniref:hypothetical protein n=1 Tax=Sunxiuqinia sp. sy24 TaxID=3461495 RepID=UPI004045807D
LSLKSNQQMYRPAKRFKTRGSANAYFYTFLDESNFQTPAIAKEEKLDDEFFDEKYFEIIKNQSDCVSFYYLLGEEYMRRITYIKRENKVVEFWSCC